MLFAGDEALVRRAGLQLLEAVGLPNDAAMAPLLTRVQRLAEDPRADPQARADAVRLLAMRDVEPYEALLRRLLTRAEPAPVQAAAVRALAKRKGADVATTFVELWERWTPAVRDEAVRALVQEPGRIRVLLDAVAAGRIKPTEIDRALRIRLMMVDDDTERERARALFAERSASGSEAVARSRKEIVERYGAATTLDGDPDRGRQVFSRVCAACHQYRGAGGAAFGPDLGEVRNHLPDALLVDILQPNQSIADRYALWNVTLTDGTAIAGIIGEETPDAVTFRLPGGGTLTLPRARIASMHVSNISAMPEGLESQIDVQQMADLIAFIKKGR
jgi:putative heme-binding domain-containing protein